MKKYKIAYFVTHPIQYQIPLLRLISEKTEIDLTIFFLTDQGVKEYNDIEFGRKIKWKVDMLSGLKYHFLKKNINEIKFGFLNPFITKLSKEAISTKWDAVWFHGYNNISLLLHFIYFSFFKKIPIIFRGESTLLCSKKSFLKNIFLKIYFSRINAFLYISKDNKDYYLNYKINKNKLFFSPYCVDNNHFQSLNNLDRNQINDLKYKYKINNSLKTILFVGKLIKRKNCSTLLEAFIDLNINYDEPLANLIIIGDGPEKKNILKKIDKFKFKKNIKLLGFLNIDEIVQVYKISDIFCIPSFTEPFGLVVPEALNSQNAIIASDQVGCARDLVINNLNGYIVPPNKKGLYNAIKKLIGNEELIKSMKNESLKLMQNWSYDQNIDNLIKSIRFIKNEK